MSDQGRLPCTGMEEAQNETYDGRLVRGVGRPELANVGPRERDHEVLAEDSPEKLGLEPLPFSGISRWPLERGRERYCERLFRIGKQPIEVYEELSTIVDKFARRTYGGSVKSDFNTMKCIDLFHSQELDRLASKYSKTK